MCRLHRTPTDLGSPGYVGSQAPLPRRMARSLPPHPNGLRSSSTVSPIRLEVMCDWCGQQAPVEVVATFEAQLVHLAPVDYAEAGEASRPPNIWLMRAGGGTWAPAKFRLPNAPRAAAR